jgi:signal transduction histidine kinase
VLDLRAETLEGRSLPDALADLVNDYRHRGNLRFELDIVGKNHPLPTRLEAGLYRITQEALNNVAQHAKASQVSIRLIITLEEIQLMIEDDGQGFDMLEPVKERFGLVGINERVHLLGGQLDLRSSPGEGTQLDIRIPQHVT